MNPLQIRLAALRRRLRMVVTFRGLSWVVALLLLVLALAGLLDWRIHLPDLVRAVLLAATLAAAGYVAWRYLIGPLWAKADDLSLALRVEEHYPALNDALASAVQFLEAPAGVQQETSASMRREAVQRALGLARGFDFNPVVDTRGVRSAGLSLALAGGWALMLALLYPQLAQTAFLRLAHPFGGYAWPRQTQLDIKARARVARGEAFEINATVTGVIPDRAIVEYRFEGSAAARELYQITGAEGAATGKLTARLEAGRVQRNFRYQVRANDATSAWLEVEVLPPPQFTALGGRPSPQIHLLYPAYTDLREQDLPDGASSLETIAGTHVTLRVATDRPVARAWLEYPPELEPLLGVAGTLNAFGQPTLASIIDLACTRPEVSARIPARLSDDSRILEVDFIARVSGTLALRFEDELGIGNVRLIELRTLQDPAPVVHLERPSRSQDSLDVLPDAEVTIRVQAADLVFALRSVYLEYRSASPSAAAERREARTGRLVFYDHESVGAAVPSLFWALSGSGLPVAAPPLRLRRQQLDISRRWSITDLGLKEGDLLILQACADDFDDVTVDKQPGRSQEVELRIVGKNALEIALNEAQAQIHQELLRLQKQQQEALEKVIPAETFWRNNKGPLQPKHLDDLLQAEQLQQQIRARVGTRQEGLRAEVARVQQALKDNHLPRSATQDRMQAIANELDRLAREELEQIEPRLTEARKETEMGRTPPRGEDKSSQAVEENRTTDNKEKAPLPEARRHQEEVKKTLDELLKLLEPWSSTREVKGEAKSILQDQHDLHKQTEELANDTRGKKLAELDSAQKAELEKTAELQNKLAERTSQLLDKLDRLAKARPADDPEAQAMKQAAEKGQRGNVAGAMKAAEENLRNNNVNEASAGQQQSKKAMEEVVKALDDRREEDLDRLIKKMKQVEDKLADLADKQDLLQKKMKKAAESADPAERARELKRLARDQEQLRQEAQEMVRELSRLRADRASQALSQAGSQMQRAARQMERGQDADEQQQEALDRLNDAQQQLQDNREKAEEELAREKMAKIAEVIKGIRARQEALSAETARIQRAVLEAKHWSRPLLGSQISLSDAQKDLSKETTDIAKDKLEGAKVFAHLLNKSAEAMGKAAEQMLASSKENNAVQAGQDGRNLAAQASAAADTAGWQRTALRRLDQLLDALKEENGKMMRANNQGQGGSGGGGEGGGGQKGGDGDNIPPLAQLKALKALEQEVYERTRDFNKRHPDAKKLDGKVQDQLKSLRREQQEIMDLYQEITAPREPEGGKK
jgi:hypothetical protein